MGDLGFATIDVKQDNGSQWSARCRACAFEYLAHTKDRAWEAASGHLRDSHGNVGWVLGDAFRPGSEPPAEAS